MLSGGRGPTRDLRRLSYVAPYGLSRASPRSARGDGEDLVGRAMPGVAGP